MKSIYWLTQGNIIKVAQRSNLQKGTTVFIFDKGLLEDGISHITIFNDQKQPVCERLYFKKPVKQLGIKLNTAEKDYSTRKKVSITIENANTGVKKDSASLSMAVYRLDSLQSSDAPDINSFLLIDI